MLQVVFHAQMEKEAGTFDIGDVADEICAKLIHRHPHVFAEIQADNSEEALKNWEAIKNQEKSRATLYEKLKSIPPMTPALMRAQKVSAKSGRYKDTDTQSIAEQVAERANDIVSKRECTSEDIGDLLFLVSALCGKEDIDSEKALFDKTNAYIEDFKG